MDLSRAAGRSSTSAAMRAWSPRFTAQNSKPAVLAFDGDVYDGLEAHDARAPTTSLGRRSHVAILSGLYGVLRPLDKLQPYRLEMGTALANGRPQPLRVLGRHHRRALNGALAADRRR